MKGNRSNSAASPFTVSWLWSAVLRKRDVSIRRSRRMSASMMFDLLSLYGWEIANVKKMTRPTANCASCGGKVVCGKYNKLVGFSLFTIGGKQGRYTEHYKPLNTNRLVVSQSGVYIICMHIIILKCMGTTTV